MKYQNWLPVEWLKRMVTEIIPPSQSEFIPQLKNKYSLNLARSYIKAEMQRFFTSLLHIILGLDFGSLEFLIAAMVQWSLRSLANTLLPAYLWGAC